MLTQLSIKNFGLINKAVLEFDQGLNILTGETGAGKSILIEALRIALGDRVSASQLRDPGSHCVIEAVFEVKNKELRNSEIFDDFFVDKETELIIQRRYSPDGKNKIKINGLSVTVSQLRNIGNHLIDFHGANDHQMLLSSDSHMGMLDRLTDLDDSFEKYSSIFAEYNSLQKKLNDIQGMADSKERELDLLTHQIKELQQVTLDEAQYEELLQEQSKLNNAEKLSEYSAELINLLEGGTSGTSENISKSFSSMRSLNQLDERTATFMDVLTQLQLTNEQLVSEIRSYAEGLSFEPSQSQEINSRCDIYEDIKRKYGPALDDARKFYDEAKQRYDLLSDLEHNDSELRKEIEKVKKELEKLAKEITKKRQDASASLKKTIEKELKELGIANVKFESRVEKCEFTPKGQDKVTFYISPNAGEDLKPLAEIVSSGEAARVMLALKKALIKVDPIPVLIFDEIDAQIGGRLGTITGQKLREISRNRQVILITHLPQIASFADIHFKVTKAVKDGRAITCVDPLDKKSRVEELAKMMSGEAESTIAVKHAKELLQSAGKG